MRKLVLLANDEETCAKVHSSPEYVRRKANRGEVCPVRSSTYSCHRLKFRGKLANPNLAGCGAPPLFKTESGIFVPASVFRTLSDSFTWLGEMVESSLRILPVLIIRKASLVCAKGASRSPRWWWWCGSTIFRCIPVDSFGRGLSLF